MDKSAITLTVVDANRKTVVWYTKSFIAHYKEHKEIQRHYNDIEIAIKNPTKKFVDKRRKATHYFLRVNKDRYGNDLYFEVIVDYTENPAFIRSAHLTIEAIYAKSCV